MRLFISLKKKSTDKCVGSMSYLGAPFPDIGFFLGIW